ncbi:hypothetical protein JTB14_037211 [Gonioctena quinquepunctata]|nr:hypothetical protein JTB14_037211 [Gonioctena quinquepunctata]
MHFHSVSAILTELSPAYQRTHQLSHVTSWGAEGGTLLKATTRIRQNDECLNHHDGLVLQDFKICTDPVACVGDYGAPLIFMDPKSRKDFLIGLVSSFDPSCGGMTTIYTKLDLSYDWLKDTLAANIEGTPGESTEIGETTEEPTEKLTQKFVETPEESTEIGKTTEKSTEIEETPEESTETGRNLQDKEQSVFRTMDVAEYIDLDGDHITLEPPEEAGVTESTETRDDNRDANEISENTQNTSDENVWENETFATPVTITTESIPAVGAETTTESIVEDGETTAATNEDPDSYTGNESTTLPPKVYHQFRRLIPKLIGSSIRKINNTIGRAIGEKKIVVSVDEDKVPVKQSVKFDVTGSITKAPIQFGFEADAGRQVDSDELKSSEIAETPKNVNKSTPDEIDNTSDEDVIFSSGELPSTEFETSNLLPQQLRDKLLLKGADSFKQNNNGELSKSLPTKIPSLARKTPEMVGDVINNETKNEYSPESADIEKLMMMNKDPSNKMTEITDETTNDIGDSEECGIGTLCSRSKQIMNESRVHVISENMSDNGAEGDTSTNKDRKPSYTISGTAEDLTNVRKNESNRMFLWSPSLQMNEFPFGYSNNYVYSDKSGGKAIYHSVSGAGNIDSTSLNSVDLFTDGIGKIPGHFISKEPKISNKHGSDIILSQFLGENEKHSYVNSGDITDEGTFDRDNPKGGGTGDILSILQGNNPEPANGIPDFSEAIDTDITDLSLLLESNGNPKRGGNGNILSKLLGKNKKPAYGIFGIPENVMDMYNPKRGDIGNILSISLGRNEKPAYGISGIPDD